MENRYPVLRCPLLRPRGEWPHRHAANQRHELQPPHLAVPRTLGPRLVQWLRLALCDPAASGKWYSIGLSIYQVRCLSWVKLVDFDMSPTCPVSLEPRTRSASRRGIDGGR